MDQIEPTRKDLLEEIDGFFMQLVYLKDLINVSDDIYRHRNKMQDAPEFTLIVECALSDSYMFVLMRLYDKTRKAITIPKLIRKCKKNICLFPSPTETMPKLNEFEERMEEDKYIEHAIKTLLIRRNSQYAHNGEEYFGAKLKDDKTTLKRYHIWAIVNYTEELLVYLHSALCSDKNIRETKYNRDLENLL